MSLKNTLHSYGAIAKAFHWVVAILILCLLAMGLTMTGMENNPDKFRLYGLHKSFGITVLALASLRLGWKAVNVSPLLPATMDKLSVVVAKAVHGALYVMMFAMPITGWVMSSAKAFPVSVFGLFLLPNIVEPNKELGDLAVELHGILAWGLMGLIALHVAGALLHHFYYKDNILKRMLPFTRSSYNALDSDTGC